MNIIMWLIYGTCMVGGGARARVRVRVQSVILALRGQKQHLVSIHDTTLLTRICTVHLHVLKVQCSINTKEVLFLSVDLNLTSLYANNHLSKEALCHMI